MKIQVSIVCNAYNHEKYIKDALESFINQKTNFDFEILIHDDASTDGTADIIRSYEKKYPDLIKPIYQTENQYSKNVPIGKLFQFPRALGKYIALCEGDDYWTDDYKLQKQFDAMERHPEIDMCAHAAVKVNEETKNIIANVMPADKNTILSVEDVIMGGGGYVATNSLFFRKELTETPPRFREYLNIDYSLQIQGALRGGMLYLSDNMASYRWMSKGSWTSKFVKNDNFNRTYSKRIINMLHLLNDDTDKKYSDVIDQRLLTEEISYLNSVRENTRILKKYAASYKKLGIKQRIKILIRAYFPFLIRFKYKVQVNK